MKVSRQIRVPFYVQVYEALLQAIREGRYPTGSYLPSEHALGREFKVDRQTVRRSLELLVNEGVVEKRAGLGTRVKDFAAREKPVDGHGVVAFILPRIRGSYDRMAEPFNAKLFYLLEAELSKHGYSLVSLTADGPADVQEAMSRGRYHGAIFVSTIPVETISKVRMSELPAVVTGCHFPEYPCVMEDSGPGVNAGIRHLFDLGHRRIGFINGIPHYISSQDRLGAYRRSLGEVGIDWNEQVVRNGDWSFDSGFQAMKDILEREQRPPTAVFACNDMMAIGAVEAVKAAGLSVPGDVSILGHDDIDQCQRMRPKLSTIGVDLELMCWAICNNLVDAISQRRLNCVKVVVPTKLIVRDSTGAAPAPDRTISSRIDG